jgi:hypothetical protein
MSDLTTTATRSRPGRAERPERLIIGGKEFVRNDIIARDQGVTERTINRGDRQVRRSCCFTASSTDLRRRTTISC